jgi:DNA modification methylase
MEGLRLLPDASVHLVCTSPPYWGLRDYQAEGQFGLEKTPGEYVEKLVSVFREIGRVLRSDGAVWLNLGDSYASQEMTGLKPKDLVGIPWRTAFALQADGWYLRSGCPWVRYNTMPESVSDRPSSALEYVFLLSHPNGGGRYFYDVEATRLALAASSVQRLNQRTFYEQKGGEKDYKTSGTNANRSARKTVENIKEQLEEGTSGRRRRNTDWFFDSVRNIAAGGQGLLADDLGDPTAFVINPRPYAGAHFATWPPDLVEPMIKAGSSEQGCCPTCGAPWERVLQSRESEDTGAAVGGYPDRNDGGHRERAPTGSGGGNLLATRTVGTDQWQPSCSCTAPKPARCVVLDPFSGSATTGAVALELGRNYIGIDLNEDYLPLAEARLLGEAPPEQAKEDPDSIIIDLFRE